MHKMNIKIPMKIPANVKYKYTTPSGKKNNLLDACMVNYPNIRVGFFSRKFLIIWYFLLLQKYTILRIFNTYKHVFWFEYFNLYKYR